MENFVSSNGSIVYSNNVIDKTFNLENEKLQNDNKKVSFDSSKAKEKVDEFISKDKEFLSTCTDGQDDGKVSFKEGAKAFLGGVANHYMGYIEGAKNFVKENPIKAAALAVGALAVGVVAVSLFGAPILMAGLSAVGVVAGVKAVYNGVKGGIKNIQNAKNAQTDAEKKEALYGLGDNSAEIIDGTIALYGGVKGLKVAHSKISNVDDYMRNIADSADDIDKNLDDFLKKIENGSISDDELDVLKSYIEKKDELFKVNPYMENLYNKISNWIKQKV